MLPHPQADGEATQHRSLLPAIPAPRPDRPERAQVFGCFLLWRFAATPQWGRPTSGRPFFLVSISRKPRCIHFAVWGKFHHELRIFSPETLDILRAPLTDGMHVAGRINQPVLGILRSQRH